MRVGPDLRMFCSREGMCRTQLPVSVRTSVAISDVDQEKKDRRGGAAVLADEQRGPATGPRDSWRRKLHRHSLLSGAVAVLIGYLILAAVLVGAGLVITHPLAHSVGAWDDHMNAWFARHRDSAANRFSSDFTFLANTPGIAVVATLAVVITLLLRRARLAVMLLVALAIELTVFVTVNYAVGRPRPHVSHVASTPSTYSWPSGHVAATLTLYGGIALIVAAITARPVPRVAAWLVAVFLVVCVALSRVYQGEHHPTDALAGLLLGVGALWVANRAIRAWQSASDSGKDRSG
jgi:membrane-associated phospholipid phosphatase